MKKILMRAAMSPLAALKPFEVISKNRIGNNMGNMLFPHSISRTLTLEDTDIDTIRFSRELSDEEAAGINDAYSCLVLPFANAFRLSFMRELQIITSLVRRIQIPCIVVGIGIQAALDEELNDSDMDAAVKEFVRAILEKSDSLGLRGEYTAAYLRKLGFQEERDFTVIGCPSMFLYGKELPRAKKKPLTPSSPVSTNSKIFLPQHFHDFMVKSWKQLPNHYYIPQVIEEIYRMYAGKPFPKKYMKEIPKGYPADFSHPLYVEDRAMAFVNVKSWLEFLSGMDFSFGSRIHGNIAAILAGTPAYVFVSDSRIRELVEYHRIPHRMVNEITEETSILQVYEEADFSQIHRGHEKRFLHYLDFLRKNGFETIYDEKGNAGKVWFDEQLQELSFPGAVHALPAVSVRQQVKRLDKCWKAMIAKKNHKTY